MKNKIIKIVLFSFLALSVALCAVFTLPKKDNLMVNAQDSINPVDSPYSLSVPFNSAVVEYIAEGNVQSWAFFPIGLTFYGVQTSVYGYRLEDLTGNSYFAYLGQIDEGALTVMFTAQVPTVLSYQLTAYDFYFDLSNYSSFNPLVTYQAALPNVSEPTVPLADYYVTVKYIVPTLGEEAIIQTVSYGINSLSGNFPLYEVFDSISYSDFSIIYIVSFELYVSYLGEDALSFEQTLLQISDFPYAYDTQDTFATRFFNQWDSTREVIVHEYQIDYFASIVQSVDSFMKTEFLPNVSFYDLLLFCIVIPLVVAILKMWLGG